MWVRKYGHGVPVRVYIKNQDVLRIVNRWRSRCMTLESNTYHTSVFLHTVLISMYIWYMHIHIQYVCLHIYAYIYISHIWILRYIYQGFHFLLSVFPNRTSPINRQLVVVAMSTCAGVLLRTAKKQASCWRCYTPPKINSWNLKMMVWFRCEFPFPRS